MSGVATKRILGAVVLVFAAGGVDGADGRAPWSFQPPIQLPRPPGTPRDATPSPAAPPPPPPANRRLRTLRVLHLTDVHLDMSYAAGAEADCAAPPCCRRPAPSHSIVPPPPKAANNADAGAYGEHTCDTPLLLLQSALDAGRG